VVIHDYSAFAVTFKDIRLECTFREGLGVEMVTPIVIIVTIGSSTAHHRSTICHLNIQFYIIGYYYWHEMAYFMN
jgi:hypothetical protein